MRALIVDDEEKLRESLKFLIQKNCPTVRITGTASLGEEQILSFWISRCPEKADFNFWKA